MKPYPFTYRRARSVDDVIELLAEHGDDMRILAGGLSLVPMMNLRLASPPQLVDVNRVPGLDDIRADDTGNLHVGAMVRHQNLVGWDATPAAEGFPLLSLAGRWIGHAPIRARGTVGGTLAHCDPTAEWCICALLLDARMHAMSVRGERTIPADQWFGGYFEPALDADEMLLGVTFPRPRRHVGFREYAQRSGDFAIAAVGVVLDLDDDGVVSDPRVVVGGVSGVPTSMPMVQSLLDGSTVTEELVVHAGALAGQAVEGRDGAYGDAKYQQRLVASLTAGAVGQAAGLTPEQVAQLGYKAVLEMEAGAAA